VRLHAKRILVALTPILIIAGGMALLGTLEGRATSAGPIAWFSGAFGLVLFIWWRVRHHPQFDFQPYDDRIIFEFRDSRVAEDFRRLNPRVGDAGSLTSARSGRGV
jgi:hypothetical protein